jgi:diguanylate cyclase (GGDEF)-like protein
MKKQYFSLATALLFSLVYWLLPGYSNEALFLKRASLSLSDILFQVRDSSEKPPPAKEKIVLIAIDDESSARLGIRWPWPRTLFAKIIERLKEMGCSSVGLNFTFSGYESTGVESTQVLAEAIRSHGNIVVGSSLEGERLQKPSKLLLEAGAKFGFLEKIVDDDFVIRRAYLQRSYRHGGSEPSFPLVLWRSQEARDPSVENWTKKDGSYTLNYLLKDSDLLTLSAWKILEGKISPSILRGKTAIVGITSSLLSEKHQTPLGLMPGLVVHANEWVALEENRPLKEISKGICAWLGYIAGMLLLCLFFVDKPWIAVLGFIAGLFGIFFSGQFWISKDILLSIFLPLAGLTLAMVSGVLSHLVYLFLENKGLLKKVIQDKMTGLYTYDYLRMRLDDEWKRCEKFKLPVSIVMTDLDRFKKINDTLGHEVGNEMILRAASVIRESVRGYDVVSRYGGDEFVILLWHSNQDEALAYRQRLRLSYETMAKKLEEPRLQDSSISIGIASFDPKSGAAQPKNPQELIEKADKDLFTDKESRRKPGEPTR